jgi:hypothetical protein
MQIFAVSKNKTVTQEEEEDVFVKISGDVKARKFQINKI